jgi:hypothetical protein
MYGDIEVTREGDRGPFRVLFRPYNQTVVATLGHSVENPEDLLTFLEGLGLAGAEVSKLSNELRRSVSGGIRTLVSTVKLRQNRLV